MIVWWQYGTSLVVRWFFDTSSTVVRYYGDQLSTQTASKVPSMKYTRGERSPVSLLTVHLLFLFFLILDAKVLIFSGNSKAFCRFFAQKRLKGMNFDDFLKNSSKAEKIFFSLFFEFFLFISGKVLIFALDSVSPKR